MTQADSNPTEASAAAPLHMIDIIRKKRDGGALNEREIAFVANGRGEWLDSGGPACGVADGVVDQRALAFDETRALTLAMRDSGEKFSPAGLGKRDGRQAFLGRRGRQDEFSRRAARGGVRRGCAHDQRARAGPHRRNAG